MGGSFLVKKQAREFLKGNWAVFIAAFAALFVPFLFADIIETFILFLGIENADAKSFIEAFEKMPVNASVCLAIEALKITAVVLFLPLISGITRIGAAAARGERVCASDIFYYFSRGRYFDSLCFNLAVLLRVLFTAVLTLLPSIICAVAYYFFAGDSIISTLLLIFCIILGSCGAVAALVLTAKYFLAQYFYIDSEGGESYSAIIRRSIEYMKGNTEKYLMLFFSFVPWLLLCFFFIPLLYVFPYMTVSFANSAKWIIKTRDSERAARDGQPDADAYRGLESAQNILAGE